MVAVVVVHVMMAGITVEPGGLSITNALQGHPIFTWIGWIVQVMPLFFVMGGFSSLKSWRQQRKRGITAAHYVRDRVARLTRPALLPLSLAAITLAVLGMIGLPDDVLADVGYRIGQPLWFLAVYLGCAGLVPVMARLHERAPRATLITLIATVMAVDAAARLTEQPFVGALNLLFVWVFIQQLGFCLADGWFDWRRRWLLALAALAASGVIPVLTTLVGYSSEMFDNFNPPTTALLALGVAQVLLFSALRPWLARIAARKTVTRLSFVVNRDAILIYLWHVPVIVLITWVLLILGAPFPEPLSEEWWQTRPPLLVAVTLLLIPIVMAVAWIERRGSAMAVGTVGTVGPLIASVKVVLGIAGVVTIMVAGFTPVHEAAIALALLLMAVLLRSPRRHGVVKDLAVAQGPNPANTLREHA